jgi:hypothetical protein
MKGIHIISVKGPVYKSGISAIFSLVSSAALITDINPVKVQI